MKENTNKRQKSAEFIKDFAFGKRAAEKNRQKRAKMEQSAAQSNATVRPADGFQNNGPQLQ
jgi:hypothetical protein